MFKFKHKVIENSKISDPAFIQMMLNAKGAYYYIHPKTIAFPDGLEHLISTSSVIVDGDVKIEKGQATPEKVLELLNEYDPDTHDVTLNPDDFEGNQNFNEVKYYGKVFEGELTITEGPQKGVTKNVYVLKTATIWGANPGRCEWLCGTKGVGFHKADIEEVTFYYQKNPDGSIGELLYGHYAPHSTYDGQCVNAEDIEMIDGHPVIYCALYGHGAYNKAGTHYRYFGFANDYTEANPDFLWKPGGIDMNGPGVAVDLFNYNFDIGDEHVNIRKQNMMNHYDVTVSSSNLARFLGATSTGCFDFLKSHCCNCFQGLFFSQYYKMNELKPEPEVLKESSRIKLDRDFYIKKPK